MNTTACGSSQCRSATPDADICRRFGAGKRLRRQERLALPESAGTAPAFAAVVVEDAPRRQAAVCIEIVVGDVVIRAEPGVDDEHLSRIIRIARAAQ